MGLWMNLDVTIHLDRWSVPSNAIEIAKDLLDLYGDAEGEFKLTVEWDYVHIHVRDEDRGRIPDAYLNEIQSVVDDHDGVVRNFVIVWNPDWVHDKLMWKSRTLLEEEDGDDYFSFEDDDDKIETWTQI